MKSNKLLTAVVAGSMLTPSVKAQDRVVSQNVEDYTKFEIVDVLNKENLDSEREISLDDAQLQLKIDDALNNLSSKDKKNINKVTEYYGEKRFMEGLDDIAKLIEQNPDVYGTFDDEGGYSLKEDAMKDLIKSEFSEYFEYSRLSRQSNASIIISLLSIFISGFNLGYLINRS